MPAPALCVYCRERPVDPQWPPFCSKRCKMADLGRWLSGEYRVPVTPSSTDADEDDPDGADGQHS
ncbi:MAG: DNA gyrase inhibitor YacG [Acidobacteriota bacterium]